MIFSNLIKPTRKPSQKDSDLEESLLPTSHQHSQQRQQKAPSLTRQITTHTLTILLTILLTTALLTLIRHPPSTPAPRKTKHLHCGNSTTQARALNCTFDVLTNMWVPIPCYDAPTTTEYMSSAPWRGYSSSSATHLLTLDEMSERVGHSLLGADPDPSTPPYWTPLREHVIHCALMWQRQHRGYLEGKGAMLDFHARSWEHTVHCSRSLVHMAGAGQERPDGLDEIGFTYVFDISPVSVSVSASAILLLKTSNLSFASAPQTSTLLYLSSKIGTPLPLSPSKSTHPTFVPVQICASGLTLPLLPSSSVPALTKVVHLASSP
ncbi:hypothetical protein B0J11DRAFT_575003 [Dendryphion nanum]|uniref:Uncharacterized protein n=1 Tax=Dendryphion nanum TaxID=256645 RepID=A0A9P9J2L1_9PLEO|nr:hypothetical protein B0J11DRAFT_575003 [Dendryphion nanum]